VITGSGASEQVGKERGDNRTLQISLGVMSNAVKQKTIKGEQAMAILEEPIKG